MGSMYHAVFSIFGAVSSELSQEKRLNGEECEWHCDLVYVLHRVHKPWPPELCPREDEHLSLRTSNGYLHVACLKASTIHLDTLYRCAGTSDAYLGNPSSLVKTWHARKSGLEVQLSF